MEYIYRITNKSNYTIYISEKVQDKIKRIKGGYPYSYLVSVKQNQSDGNSMKLYIDQNPQNAD